MNSWEKERAEQEAADQAEERRVARLPGGSRIPPRAVDEAFGVPPYLFADERSQRRVEEEARHERPLDDYAAWADQNEQLFR
jgi:hypothetical protein